MRAARALVAVAVAAVIVVAVVELAQSGPRKTGTNLVRLDGFVAEARGGERVCQIGEVVPAGTGSIALFVGTYGRPGAPIDVSLHAPHGAVATGRSRGGEGDGWLRVALRGPIARSAAPTGDVRVCARSADRLALGGKAVPPAAAARIARRPAAGRIALTWYRPGRQSWWSTAGTIAERATFGKADLGRWTPLVLLAAVWAGALWLVVRRRPA